MKRTLLTLLIVVALSTNPTYAASSTSSPSNAAPGPSPDSQHNTEDSALTPDLAMTRNVLASALTFMTPRLLEGHSVGELSFWGLQGLVQTNPRLNVIRDTSVSSSHPIDSIVLRDKNKTLLERPAPRDDDLAGWLDLTLSVIQHGWHEGTAFRQAGNDRLLSNFFTGLFQHLDPYSRYLSPAESLAEQHSQEDDICSAGITLTRHSDISYPDVSSININSMAWDQGIDIGQTLLAIDGHDVRRVPLTLLAHWLTGPPGSKVALTFRTRSGGTRTFALNLTRLPQETVFPSHRGPYTILRITRFSTQTAEEVSQYLSAALPNEEGDSPDDAAATTRIPGLILDLRGNHGGILQQAVVTAALLLDHGVAVTTEGRYPAANHIWTVQGGDLTNNSPVIVLVDRNTASAAEVLAAALADHHRAVIVGSQTFGKGLVQVIGEMPNKAELFISWGRNIAPQGWPIQGTGLTPQLCTSSALPSPATQLAALKRGGSLEQPILMRNRQVRAPVSSSTMVDIRKHCPPQLGEETDMDTAIQLLASPSAYQTALRSVPDAIPAHF